MSQFPWGAPLQQDPLPMEVDSSTGGWSWQLELKYPQITLPQQQDSLPMSIDPLDGGGGEDEEEWISLLRSCPLRSPPRSLLPFSPASPPDIWVTPWDPYTWTPPCSPQIDHAAEALCGIVDRLFRRLLMVIDRKLRRLKTELERLLRRPKCSVRIQYLNEDEDDDDDSDNRYDALIVEAPPRNTYDPNELLKQQFKFTKDGELQYCIHCNNVFPSGTRPSDLKKHLLLSHRLLFDLFTLLFELHSRLLLDVGASIDAVLYWFFEEPAVASNLRGLCEGYQNASEAARGNEKRKEIDSQKSTSRHVESPLAFDQSNTPPERMRVDNGRAAASIDVVQHCFFEEPAGASNSRGLWKGCQSALEAARGNEKPKEIDSQKSASGYVELPLAFDQSNTPPERMRVDNGKAAANTDVVRIDAVQNCFEETTKTDKPKGTLKKKWSGVWEHFVETIIDDTVWADCKHCKKRFAGGTKKAGTSTLRRHLDKLHGIEIPKASSSSKNENLCGGPATSKWKTPTPSLLPSLEPVASKPPGKTTQRKKRTDGVNDLAKQEVCARGKRTRRRDNPSSSGVTPSEVPSSASAAPPPTVGHAAEATSTGMVVASSQIALSPAGASGEVERSIADTIINPGPKDLTNAILPMSQAAEAVAREKMLLQEMEKLRQENTDQATAVHSRLEALEAKLVLAADENKKLKAENTALRSQPQESPHSRPASPPSKRS